MNDTPNFNLKFLNLENNDLENTRRIIWRDSDKLERRRVEL